jgi:hypothetical protein
MAFTLQDYRNHKCKRCGKGVYDDLGDEDIRVSYTSRPRKNEKLDEYCDDCEAALWEESTAPEQIDNSRAPD